MVQHHIGSLCREDVKKKTPLQCVRAAAVACCFSGGCLLPALC